MRRVVFLALLTLLLGSTCAQQPLVDTDVPQVVKQINKELLEGDVLVCDEYHQVEEIFKAGRHSGMAMDKVYNKYAALENKNGVPVCVFGMFLFQPSEYVETIFDVHLAGALAVCRIFKANFEGEQAFLGICRLKEEEILDEVVVMATSFFLFSIYYPYHFRRGIFHGCHEAVCL